MLASSLYPPLTVHLLGRMPYETAWALQRELVAAIACGDTEETLLLVEHDPVLTLGRKRGAADNVLSAGNWPIFDIERGGDATYHGPGQLVGYPLLRLESQEQDLHKYLRNLEEWLILTLADFALEARRKPPLTGVWVGDRKLASLGIAVKRWVTYHGFGLNVSTPLDDFKSLNPCGLKSEVMTSMTELLGKPISMDAVIERLMIHLPVALARQPRRGTAASLC
jgi:lipoyl(octanoyl) transferase